MTPSPAPARLISRRTACMTAAVTLTAPVSSAFAHPGDHGADWAAMVAHLLTEPFHLLLLGSAVVAGIVAWKLIARRHRSR